MEQKDYDAQRTAFLEMKGYKILRFWNNEVLKDLEGAIGKIVHVIES